MQTLTDAINTFKNGDGQAAWAIANALTAAERAEFIAAMREIEAAWTAEWRIEQAANLRNASRVARNCAAAHRSGAHQAEGRILKAREDATRWTHDVG